MQSCRSKECESLFNTVLGQDGLICDDVGWWSGFNKGGYGIGNICRCIVNIVEGMGNSNKVAPPHGATIGSYIMVVDGERIT